MRKILLLIITIVLMCFSIPILFTNPIETASLPQDGEVDNNETVENVVQYDYKEYNTIKLYHKKTDSIEELSFDEYLYGVVSAEMPASYENEALKAQAVVARTYTLFKIVNGSKKHDGADICDDSTCCQAWISKEDRLSRWKEETREEYWNKITTAVNETSGKIITYDGKVINAFFHSNSGGKTESPLYVWGGSGYPYLQSVETAGEDAYSQYYSEVTLTKDEVLEKIKEKHDDIKIVFENEDEIKIIEYTDGNRVKTVKFGNIELSGVEARTIFGLKSANFEIEISGDEIMFKVKGYGHGVGMSQTGADSLAKEGKSYEEIIKHFYTGVEIENY